MYKSTEPKTIQALFGSIATKYDLGNRVISLGLYPLWNHHLVNEVNRYPVTRLLDLCAGTGEVAFCFLTKNPKAHAILLDFCPEMLVVAEQRGKKFKDRFETLQADALAIPLPDQSVDAATIAYGIRNVADPKKCFEEVYRVLRPGGIFGILEGTRPKSPLLRTAHRLYLKTILPLLGATIAKNKNAYNYLAETIGQFTAPDILEADLKSTGFRRTWQRPELGGVATLLFAEK